MTPEADFCKCRGFHDVTSPGWIPVADVYFDSTTTIESEDSWQVILTHELFEMLADPHVNRAIVTPDGDCGRTWSSPCVFHWLETGDPVETHHYYRPGLDGTPVPISDFVTERWWNPKAVRGQFDLMNLVHHPLQVLLGGYEGLYHHAFHYA